MLLLGGLAEEQCSAIRPASVEEHPPKSLGTAARGSAFAVSNLRSASPVNFEVRSYKPAIGVDCSVTPRFRTTRSQQQREAIAALLSS